MPRRMVGKRVQLDDATWEALAAVARDKNLTFQEMADEAFADYLKKHRQPVGLIASLKESIGARNKSPARGGAEQRGPQRRHQLRTVKVSQKKGKPRRGSTGALVKRRDGFDH